MASRKDPPNDKKLMALSLRDEAQERYELRNRQMQELRQRIHQEREVNIPDNYKATANQVRLSLLGDTVRLMAAIIDDAEWRVHVDPYDVGPTAERNSSLRETWSESAFRQAQMDIGRPALTNCTTNQMQDGLGVLKVIYRPDHWASSLPTTKSLYGKRSDEMDEEEAVQYSRAVEKAKRGAKLPFCIVDVDPMTYHPMYGPDGEITCVVEIREHPLHDALLQYQGKVGFRNGMVVPVESLGEPQPYENFRDDNDSRFTVKVWEYWDREEHITFVDDVPVKYSKHGMGRVPYFECFAQASADRDPSRNSRPPMFKAQWIADFIDSLWTMLGNAAFMWAYPTPKLMNDPNSPVPVGDDGKPEYVEIEPGKLWRGFVGQDIEFLTTPVESFRHLGEMLDRANRIFEVSTGLGPAIRGLGGSDQPGYAINQLISASMFTLNPALKSRDAMIAEAIKFMWRLIEKRVGGDVWVWGTDPTADGGTEKRWLKLGPSDIDGYYRCSVTSDAMTDIRMVQVGQFWASMVQAQLMDRRGAMERMGIENPDDVLDSIEVDKLPTSGPLHDKMVEKILRNRNMLPPPPPPGALPGGPGGPPGPGGPGGPPDISGALPGLPPMPGGGMPLAPPPPPDQGLSQSQVENIGGLGGPPGRAAGGPRLPPTQNRPMPSGPQGP